MIFREKGITGYSFLCVAQYCQLLFTMVTKQTLNGGGFNVGNKIKTLDDIQHLLWSFATHRVITVAGRLGILRRLSQGRCTGRALAEELGLDQVATVKIVKALCALGFLEAKGDTYSTHSGLAEFFTSGEADLTPFLEHSHSMYDSFGENLEGWVRGEPWKTMKRDEESIRKFGLAMQAMGTGVATQVKKVLDLRGATKMLDVGGGFGHYTKALLDEYPELRSTVLDTPEVAKMGRKKVAGTPFEDRIEFVAGHYLEDNWGTGYDFVLLANVLHQELSESAAGMIRKGASAACDGGRVGVVDFSIDDQQREHILGSLFAINMRSFGDTYPEPIIRGWMERNGLRKVERIDLSDFRWLITGYKNNE